MQELRGTQQKQQQNVVKKAVSPRMVGKTIRPYGERNRKSEQ